jgi:hypothetical protein
MQNYPYFQDFFFNFFCRKIGINKVYYSKQSKFYVEKMRGMFRASHGVKKVKNFQF